MESLNGKERPADAVRFTLLGFMSVDDPALLAQLLTQYITRVREIDAADRVAPSEEE